MDIFNDKNVYVYTENDTVFILPKGQDKPVKICYEDPNRRIIANNDGSITIEDTVSLEWLTNHIVDKEDYEKIENALKEAISKTKFTVYEVQVR
jgi:nitrogen regulatory protein PII-like uncharacterized protein|nr:MAG TPA: hypothetical protein [Bacteriophage sp.]